MGDRVQNEWAESQDTEKLTVKKNNFVHGVDVSAFFDANIPIIYHYQQEFIDHRLYRNCIKLLKRSFWV